jgi:hypothetical protein
VCFHNDDQGIRTEISVNTFFQKYSFPALIRQKAFKQSVNVVR